MGVFYYLHNSLPSHAHLVAAKSIISHTIIHSAINQNGDIHSNAVQIIKSHKLWYINNAITKFNHPHINIHLKYQGILNQDKTGCTFITQKIPIIEPKVVYQNNIASLK